MEQKVSTKEVCHWPRYYNILAYGCILLVVFAIFAPIIMLNIWPPTHENTRYILLFDEFRNAFLKGILYPRWLPDACGGYGYPNFLFYQPGFFFAALPFSFLPNYPLSAMVATLALLFFVGGVGVHKLCSVLADPFIGLFCSIFYLLTPYLYVNLYVRGDLSELMAMLLCPWAIYFLVILKKCIKTMSFETGAMVGIAISLFTVIVSHPATAMFFCAVFSLMTIYVALDMGSKRREFILKISLSAGIGLILSSPYWFTMFQMKRYVDLTPALSGFYLASFHTVYVPQFFARFWGFGTSMPNTASDGMSFQLGLPHFILAVIGMIWSKKNRVIQSAFVLYVLLILLMTNYSSSLWEKISFLRYVQFPWRILSVTALLQIICISGIQNILVTRKYTEIKKIMLLLILVLSAVWYSNTFRINNGSLDVRKALELHRQIKLQGFHTYTRKNEFMPKTVLTHGIDKPRGDASLILLDPPAEIKELEGNNSYRMHYKIKNETPATLTINQYYMPGWRVVVDGQDVPSKVLENSLTENGRIRVSLSIGTDHSIEAFYGGPPGWFALNIVVLIAFVAFVGFCFYDERERLKKHTIR